MLRQWIVLAIIITGLCGLVYIIGHQNLRMSANDPQIQMSEDIARKLATEELYDYSFALPEFIDISKSLSPFVILYDDKNTVVGTSANLDGSTPQIPAGVLEYARANGQNRLTWEPKEGVRAAIVVTSFSGKNSGTVLVGRSLDEVEKREKMFTNEIVVAWLALMSTSWIATAVLLNPRVKNLQG